jgi:ubiquinone/menaquinone biosynthesis C-methylase UbiE
MTVKSLLRRLSRRRVPRNYSFEGYEIPVDLINLTGAGPDEFESISVYHLQHLTRSVGIDPDHFILEIGCGIGRDAIQLTKILSPNGRYVGVDIVKRSIDWCASNISPRFPNFSFIHYDVKDQLHNPKGSTTTRAIRLPIPNKSVHRIILWSVFTHMFRSDMLHYLSEFERVLAADGLVFATCFVVNDAIISSAQKNANLTPYALRFGYLQEPGCYINDPAHPLGAVAYTEQALQGMATKAGLVLALERGNWSGHYDDIPKGGQDVIVLSKPAT